MNIFILDESPAKAAEYHADKHVVKMIVEHNQMLSTAVILAGGPSEGLYKIAHKNHPCTVWTRESRENFIWLCDLTVNLFKEYGKRYGKEHKHSMSSSGVLIAINILGLGVSHLLFLQGLLNVVGIPLSNLIASTI